METARERKAESAPNATPKAGHYKIQSGWHLPQIQSRPVCGFGLVCSFGLVCGFPPVWFFFPVWGFGLRSGPRFFLKTIPKVAKFSKILFVLSRIFSQFFSKFFKKISKFFKIFSVSFWKCSKKNAPQVAPTLCTGCWGCLGCVFFRLLLKFFQQSFEIFFATMSKFFRHLFNFFSKFSQKTLEFFWRHPQKSRNGFKVVTKNGPWVIH